MDAQIISLSHETDPLLRHATARLGDMSKSYHGACESTDNRLDDRFDGRFDDPYQIADDASSVASSDASSTFSSLFAPFSFTSDTSVASDDDALSCTSEHEHRIEGHIADRFGELFDFERGRDDDGDGDLGFDGLFHERFEIDDSHVALLTKTVPSIVERACMFLLSFGDCIALGRY